jgi:hypothetical protein
MKTPISPHGLPLPVKDRLCNLFIGLARYMYQKPEGVYPQAQGHFFLQPLDQIAPPIKRLEGVYEGEQTLAFRLIEFFLLQENVETHPHHLLRKVGKELWQLLLQEQTSNTQLNLHRNVPMLDILKELPRYFAFTNRNTVNYWALKQTHEFRGGQCLENHQKWFGGLCRSLYLASTPNGKVGARVGCVLVHFPR